MAYALSFTDAFFGDAEMPCEVQRPQTVADAVASMPYGWQEAMAREVFGCTPETLDTPTVLDKVRETDTCDGLQPPVAVWIDAEGDYKVHVHDSHGECDECGETHELDSIGFCVGCRYDDW